MNPLACSAIEQQRKTAAREMLRRFAHVPIGEDGWPVSDDKLLKKDEVKVDEIQSRAARGVVTLSEPVSSWPASLFTVTLTAVCVLDTRVLASHE